MPKYSRLFTSTALITFLFFSSLLLSNVEQAEACGGPLPQTLLELFLNSDLAVIADVTSEEIPKNDGEYESAIYSDVRKNLRLIKIYKGQHAENLSVTNSEYFFQIKNEDGVNTGEIGRSGALLPGNRYLLFLQKNKESGEYGLAPTGSAYRELDAADEDTYDRRLSDLAAILKTRKVQSTALAEWLVKLAEEPKTLYDGTTDLLRSVDSVYRLDAKTDPRDKETPFLLTKYSQVPSPEIAESLTDSQKQRISSILDTQVRDLLAGSQEEDGGGYAPDYGLVRLVSAWDREQLTMRAYALLLNSDPAAANRVLVLMSLMVFAVDDNELYSIYERYESAASGEITEETEEPEQEAVEVPGNGTEEVSPAESKNVFNTDEAISEPAENAENAIDTEDAEFTEAQKKKLEELKVTLVRKFSDRYRYLLANGFRDEGEETDGDEESEPPQEPKEIKKLSMIADPIQNKN
jgi:hypothetical protein